MITKSPSDKDSFVKDMFFTSSARAGWRLLLESLHIEKDYKILLPAYIGYTQREGSGVFDPVVQTQTEFDFYTINSNLSFDLNEIEQKFSRNKICLLLVIHYFGFCNNNMIDIKRLCSNYNILLVEDCAHAFQLGLENHDLGNYGDFSFYSIHKYLPTQTGGILQSNNSDIELLTIPKEDYVSIDVIEQYAKTKFIEVADRRRDNYKLYIELLNEVQAIKIFYSLTEDVIPHNFPILVNNSLREKLYFYLEDNGISTIALYYRLIDQINEFAYPESHKISNSILNLPVHQDITEKDIHFICSKIIEFFSKN